MELNLILNHRSLLFVYGIEFLDSGSKPAARASGRFPESYDAGFQLMEVQCSELDESVVDAEGKYRPPSVCSGGLEHVV
jgi:hypothetical protein